MKEIYKGVGKAEAKAMRTELGEAPRHPKAGGKTDSVKHRLDDAESMIKKMADVLSSLLREVPEFKDDAYIRKHWFLKWSIKDAEKLTRKAEELLAKRRADG